MAQACSDAAGAGMFSTSWKNRVRRRWREKTRRPAFGGERDVLAALVTHEIHLGQPAQRDGHRGRFDVALARHVLDPGESLLLHEQVDGFEVVLERRADLAFCRIISRRSHC
jgi:hypothetical protein